MRKYLLLLILFMVIAFAVMEYVDTKIANHYEESY